MMNIRLITQCAKVLTSIGVVFGLLLSVGLPALALSPEQKRIYDSNIGYFDLEETIPATCGGGSAGLTGSGNDQKIWNFLISKGLTAIQAAGIMGNIQEETEPDFDPTSQELKPKSGRGGFGIAQWTASRRVDLEKAAAEKKVDVADLAFQLDYLYNESVARRSLDYPDINEWEGLKRQTTVPDATRYWLRNYERAGIPRPERRIQYAEDNLLRLGSISGGAPSSGSVTCGGGSGGNGEVVGGFSLPVDRKFYDENPGWFTKPHHDYPAADIPVATGTNVYSITAGKVIKAPAGGGCGTGIIIDSADGTQYVYCHGSDGGSVPGAKTGDQVQAGQLIMHSASTGESSGPHLHAQIKVGGQNRCPQTLFTGIASGSPPAVNSLPSSGCTY